MLIEDLRRTDHLVYVDTTMPLEEHEREAIMRKEPLDYKKVLTRKSQIAEKAYSHLKKLNIPTDAAFSDPNFLVHLKGKTQIISD